jgi:hypothetical protein
LKVLFYKKSFVCNLLISDRKLLIEVKMAETAMEFIKERVSLLPEFSDEMWTEEIEALVKPFVESLIAKQNNEHQRLFVAIGEKQNAKADAASKEVNEDDIEYKLCVTTGSDLDFGGTKISTIVYFILPRFEDSEVDNNDSSATLAQVTWGTTNKKMAHSLLLRASTVYAPAILAKGKDDDNEDDEDDDMSVLSEDLSTQKGNNNRVAEGTSDLVPALHRLLASLTEMVGNDEQASEENEASGGASKESGTHAAVLYVPSSLARGPELNDHAAFLKLAKDSSLVQQLESIVVQWTRQVRELLVRHDATIDSDGLGPREEISFWNNATAELSATCKQLQRVDVARTMLVLEAAGSSYHTNFHLLSARVNNKLEEASSNVKFMGNIIII